MAHQADSSVLETVVQLLCENGLSHMADAISPSSWLHSQEFPLARLTGRANIIGVMHVQS
jgi:hypothetical protein